MNDGTPHADQAVTGPADGTADSVDWMRIERSDEFRELTARRNRFITRASIVTFGCFGIYLALAVFARGLMGTLVLGGVPLAWLLAMSQVLLTWAVTRAYLRKADSDFAPLERDIAERAQARFTREGDATAPAAAPAQEGVPAATAPSERSAR